MKRPAPTDVEQAVRGLEARAKHVTEVRRFQEDVIGLIQDLDHRQATDPQDRFAFALNTWSAELENVNAWLGREGARSITVRHFEAAADLCCTDAALAAANPHSEVLAMDAALSAKRMQQAAAAADHDKPPAYKSQLFAIAESARTSLGAPPLPVAETADLAKRSEAFAKRFAKLGQRPERGMYMEFYSVVRGQMLREINEEKQARQLRAKQEGRELAPDELVRDLHCQYAYAVAYELRYLPAAGEPWTLAQRLCEAVFEYRWRLFAEALGLPLSPEGHASAIDALGIAAFDAADADELAAHRVKVAADRDRVEAEKRAAQAREDQAKQAENDRAEKAIAEAKANGKQPGDIATTTAAGGGMLIIKIPA